MPLLRFLAHAAHYAAVLLVAGAVRGLRRVSSRLGAWPDGWR